MQKKGEKVTGIETYQVIPSNLYPAKNNSKQMGEAVSSQSCYFR